MRFTAIFFLTTSLVDVAFSYTAKELDMLPQYLVALGLGIEIITADLAPFSGGGGNISQILQLESDGVSLTAIDRKVVEFIDAIRALDSAGPLFSIFVTYPGDLAVDSFIIAKPFLDLFAYISLVEPILSAFVDDLIAPPRALLRLTQSSLEPELIVKATALVEEYEALREKALAAYS